MSHARERLSPCSGCMIETTAARHEVETTASAWQMSLRGAGHDSSTERGDEARSYASNVVGFASSEMGRWVPMGSFLTYSRPHNS